MVEIKSPFPEHCLPRVWDWMIKFRHRVMDDFSPKTREAYINQCLENLGRLRTWGVYVDGELGGMVTFEQWTPVLGTCHCVFKRELWGREITHVALSQIAEQIFAGNTRKISMCVFSDNSAIRSLLSKLGAVVEGNHKEHTMRDGKPADMVTIALFREKFNASTGNRGGDRGGEFADRRRPVVPAEAADEHNDASVVPGDAGTNEPAIKL